MINLGQSNVTQKKEMTLNLKKNEVLNLTKKNPGLKRVNVGVGWDIANTGQAFDLDISAFLLSANGKISGGSDVIFYNNMSSSGIQLQGDNRNGVGDGDDEIISIDLAQVRSDVHKIVFAVTIHEGMANRQTFGMVNNSYVRLLDVDRNDSEICIFNLKTDSSTATAVIFAELYRDGSDWQFKALGESRIADLNDIFSLYQ